MPKNLIVRGSKYQLPQVWTEDGEVCATDRVFNGYASLFAASPELLAACEQAADAARRIIGFKPDVAAEVRGQMLALLERMEDVIAKATEPSCR
jgi:hypothetical protein